jgi:FKBP-type peptidyl-prolyl cis-trans isomerase FkpA
MLYKLFLAIILAFGFFACKPKKTVDQPAVDEQIITQYISDHKLNAKATGSGLYYVTINAGNGARPVASSNVTVNYKGYLSDGSVFDQSASSGVSFGLANVIQGWQEGIPLFKKGGKGILLIPSALGYGASAQSSIPANSVLIFDIELLDVK